MSNNSYGQQNPGHQPQGANPYQQQSGLNVPPPNQSGPQPYSAHDAEQGNAHVGFNDQTIRAQFVRKVRFTVAAILVVVALISAFPFTHPAMMLFVRQHDALSLFGYITAFSVFIAMFCCKGVSRTYPINFILTGVLTLSIGLLMMGYTAQCAFVSVFVTFAMTAISCAGVAFFATETTKDLRSLGDYVFIAMFFLKLLFGLGLLIVGVLYMFGVVGFTLFRIMAVVHAAIGAYLCMQWIWLAIVIQMIMRGINKTSSEEHIFASIIIAFIIIQIFLFLLIVFGLTSLD